MNKKILILVLFVVMFVMAASFIPSAAARSPMPIPNMQDITPTPNVKIDVPAFTIQIFAPGPNPLVNQADARNRVAGVLQGIWNGIISPITLVVSFFTPTVQMYEVHNDGSPYNLGFLVGIAILFTLLGMTAGSRRRLRR